MILNRLLGLTILCNTLLRYSSRNLSMSSSINNRVSFGAGCYWGTEKFFKADFGSKLFPNSITSGAVGFMGGAKPNPSYRDVCTGSTGHVEVYDLFFDGKESTYENLVRHFFSFHDPTTKNRQGNDVGTQYASAIFCYDNKQKELASKVLQELQVLVSQGKVPLYKGKTIETEIRDASTFFPAMLEHQQYLEKNPGGYCNHAYRFKKWPS